VSLAGRIMAYMTPMIRGMVGFMDHGPRALALFLNH
jgi:hypothetical protein